MAVKRVGVVGSGIMGGGITEVAACKHLGEHATDAELALEPLDGLERKRCYFQARGGLG